MKEMTIIYGDNRAKYEIKYDETKSASIQCIVNDEIVGTIYLDKFVIQKLAEEYNKRG